MASGKVKARYTCSTYFFVLHFFRFKLCVIYYCELFEKKQPSCCDESFAARLLACQVSALSPMRLTWKPGQSLKVPHNKQLFESKEKMVQVNLKSKKERKIRQMEESGKRGEELKLPELQALSSSTGDEVAWRGVWHYVSR